VSLLLEGDPLCDDKHEAQQRELQTARESMGGKELKVTQGWYYFTIKCMELKMMMQAGSTHDGTACDFLNQEATEKQADDSGSNACLPGQARQVPLGKSGDGVRHYVIWSATWPRRNLAGWLE
jgi:hypothetical protein